MLRDFTGNVPHHDRRDNVEDRQHHEQRAVADFGDQHAEHHGERRRTEKAEHSAHPGRCGHLVFAE